jgi:hypothetical protein
MLEILESKLTKEEREELHDYMLNHPYGKVVNLIEDVKGKRH